MILQHFKTERYRSTFTSYADIHSLPWAGDSPEQMESFLRNWDLLIENMPEPGMPEDPQRDLFFERYEESKILKENVWAYRRDRMNDNTHGCYSLTFLKTSMEMFIADSRHQKNLSEMRQSFKKGMAGEIATDSKDASAMAAATAKGRGRGRGKGSDGKDSKGSGKSQSTKGTAKDSGKAKGNKPACWYHNSKKYKQTAPCKFGDSCKFVHTIVSYLDFMKMPVPKAKLDDGYLSDSSASSASSAGSTKSKKKSVYINYCRDYLKTGVCTKEKCKRKHYSKAELKTAIAELKSKHKTDGGKSGGKGQNKASPKAAAAPATPCVLAIPGAATPNAMSTNLKRKPNFDLKIDVTTFVVDDDNPMRSVARRPKFKEGRALGGEENPYALCCALKRARQLIRDITGEYQNDVILWTKRRTDGAKMESVKFDCNHRMFDIDGEDWRISWGLMRCWNDSNPVPHEMALQCLATHFIDYDVSLTESQRKRIQDINALTGISVRGEDPSDNVNGPAVPGTINPNRKTVNIFDVSSQ